MSIDSILCSAQNRNARYSYARTNIGVFFISRYTIKNVPFSHDSKVFWGSSGHFWIKYMVRTVHLTDMFRRICFILEDLQGSHIFPYILNKLKRIIKNNCYFLTWNGHSYCYTLILYVFLKQDKKPAQCQLVEQIQCSGK